MICSKYFHTWHASRSTIHLCWSATRRSKSPWRLLDARENRGIIQGCHLLSQTSNYHELGQSQDSYLVFRGTLKLTPSVPRSYSLTTHGTRPLKKTGHAKHVRQSVRESTSRLRRWEIVEIFQPPVEEVKVKDGRSKWFATKDECSYPLWLEMKEAKNLWVRSPSGQHKSMDIITSWRSSGGSSHLVASSVSEIASSIISASISLA